MKKGTIYSISISQNRGELKKEVPEANFIENSGIENDGHSGDWGRQVTCLSVERVNETNLKYRLNAGPGDFAENILIEGLDLSAALIGTRLTVADSVVLEVTQIGKEDHPSIVSRTLGVSLLPYEGLFCKVVCGGRIKKGDPVILEHPGK